VKINLAVCGKFHYHNYVQYLDQADLLGRFYYSHRFSTDAAALGISREHAINLWVKQYALEAHDRLTRGWLVRELAPWYGDLWQRGVLRHWAKSDILHLLLHGTGRALIRRAKSEGSCVIVEAVNQHPEGMMAILSEEHERLGLKPIRKLPAIHERLIEELAAADFLLAPSVIVRDSFVKRGYDHRRTATLAYGVDLHRFRPLSTEGRLPRGKPFTVICVAQITPRKGHLYLLQAWKKLGLPNSELLLIGGVSLEMSPILRRYMGIRHIPKVPNSELREYYARSSVFVLPSLEDGFAVVCAEAMACGLPVITTVNTGAADIIADQKDGFIVPIRSPDAIAEHLELLYRDDGLRQEMSAAALAKARTELSWQRYAAQLRKFYYSVFESKAHLGSSEATDAATVI
jgi:glycosyltransferase involved in cell wall biosynthesis